MTDENEHDTPHERRQVIELHVYHHVDHRLVESIEKIAATLAGDPRPAVGARLSVGEQPMSNPVSITVDTVNEQATVVWVDDHGDTNAAAPAGAVVAFASDNPAALTVDAATGKLTVVGEGVANVSLTITNPDGSPFLEADGVTPFPVDAPVAVTVNPGAAVGDQLSVGPAAV